MLIFNETDSLISLYSQFWYQLQTVRFFKNYFELLSSTTHITLIQNESYQENPEESESCINKVLIK